MNLFIKFTINSLIDFVILTFSIKGLSIFSFILPVSKIPEYSYSPMPIFKKTEIGLKLNELKKQQLELEKEGYENGK